MGGRLVRACGVLIILFVLSMLGSSRAEGATEENLLRNGGFEQVDAQGKAESWSMESWQSTSRLGLTKGVSHGGSIAAFLYADQENDIRLVQTVQVKPDTVYCFSGWMAVRGVSDKGLGATLCVMGGSVHSPGLKGITAWQREELVFKTGSGQTQVAVGARLGFFGDTARGTAFFDDLELAEVDDPSVAYQQLSAEAEKPYAHGAEGPELTGDRPWENGPGAMGGRLLGKIAGYPTWIILFYLLLLLLLYLRFGKTDGPPGLKRKWSWDRVTLIFLIAAAVNILIRIPLFKAAPFPTDMGCFKAWALRMADLGPGGFYSPGYFCDYPPFALYILGAAGWIVKAFSWDGHEFLFSAAVKLPALLCDLGTAWLILQLLRRKSPRLGLLLAVIYMYLPAVLYNSSYWGQVDTYYMFLMILAFYLIVKDKPALAAVCVAASLLTKAQTMAFLPVLVFFMVLRYKPKRIAGIMSAAFLATAIIVLPFNWGKPLTWIFSHYANMASQYKYASFNAANFPFLLGGNKQTDITVFGSGLDYQFLGISLFIAAIVWCCYYLRHRWNKAGLAATLTAAAWAFFLFFPWMHERYLFPALGFLFLTFGYTRDKRLFFIGILLSLTYLCNLHAVILYFGNSLQDPLFSRVMYILSLANTVLFAVFILILQSRLPGWGRRFKSFLHRYDTVFAEHLKDGLKARPFRLGRRDYLLLGILLALYSIFIFFRLGSWHTPQTGMDLREPVEIILPVPTDISAVAVYEAKGTGRFLVEKYTGRCWTQAVFVPCQDFYVLKRLPLAATGVERLRLLPQPSAGRINEIAFLGSSGEPVPIKSVLLQGARGVRQIPAGRSPLFDEQERMRAKPSYLNSTYFDEIYHGRTGYEFLQGTAAYEKTHPPFGKDLLALGIAVFGMNPFGMRFMHALMGVLLMLLLFLLGRQVLASRFGAYAVMALGMLDFVPFVVSRYATIDTTSVLLIGLMFLFVFKFVREQETAPVAKKSFKTMACVVFFFALAAATKWTAVYGFAGVAAIFLFTKLRQYLAARRQAAPAQAPRPKKEKRNVKRNEKKGKIPAGSWIASVFIRKNLLPSITAVLLILLLIAPFVYYLTYIPFLNSSGVSEVFSGQGVQTALQSQKNMYDYHSKLKATHPFASSWWSWPFDFKPLWIYPDKPIEVKPGNKSAIVIMGNPLIWWLGAAAMLFLLYKLLTIRRFSVMHLVSLGFLSLYLPWVLVGRITFIYHYYPVLPFVYLITAGFLEPFWNMGGRSRRLVWAVFALGLILLALFYPVLSGAEVPGSYVDHFLRWFPGDWVF